VIKLKGRAGSDYISLSMFTSSALSVVPITW
jgi:hypothetical protein